MTDDSRFRAPRAPGFSQAQPAGARVRRTEDPLAELARLIGQEDPFADFVAHRPADGRAGGHSGAQRRPHARDTRPHDPRALERRRSAAPLRSPDSLDGDHDDFGPDERLQTESRSAYSYGSGRTLRTGDAPAVSARGLRDDRAAVPPPLARPMPERHAPSRIEADAELEHEQPRSARDPRSVRRAPAPAADDDGSGEYAAEDYDPEYDDDAYLPAHGDEFYEEAPRRRLKGWMLVSVAAVAAIVVGTSGLFAYRALFGTDTVAAPAKIISPDASPTKMVPQNAAQPASGKQVQDRVGGEPPRNAERIVSREESPIDQSRIPQGGTADRIPAGTVTAAPQFSPAPAQPAPAAAPAPAPTVAPANVSTEPRRVRTVTVRADGSVVSDPARPAANSANAARTAPATGAANPLALQGGQAGALPPPRPAATTSSAPLRGDNPWSSVTSSGQVGTPAPQAALPPPAPVQSAPPPTIAVQSAPAAGSYVVQVAAQKSEAEAQATWQSLQQRYGSVLGAQQATIRRVDLGERGVFYRAQVGPFGTRAQASEVCQSLKAAGGECVIQRN